MKYLLMFLICFNIYGTEELKYKNGDSVKIKYVPDHLLEDIPKEEIESVIVALRRLVGGEELTFYKCKDDGVIVNFERCHSIPCLLYHVKHNGCDIINKYQSNQLEPLK